ncbi:MAG TPA: transposase [Ktedonobacteraceae bacterium]
MASQVTGVSAFVQVTARAILRFMHSLPLPAIAPPRIIGLDDWAWKRGQRYGAVVVDLERKKPIALLADRSQEAVAGWLKRYPTIQIVARDRSKEFAAAITAALPQGFLDLIRRHNGEGLDTWLKNVRASTVGEFLAFARSVQQDKAAILAGLTLPYSTGPVEGHINRLKLIKRQAYGRAELPYLQRRFLPAA